MPRIDLAGVLVATLLLGGCITAGPAPGTTEYAAAQVSRGFDCGLRVDRTRIAARLPRQERRPFLVANAGYAVKSYNAPRPCGASERADVQRRLRDLAR